MNNRYYLKRDLWFVCVWFFLWGFEATVFLGKSLNLTDSRNTMPGANGAEITAAEPASFGENLRWPTLQSFAPHQCEYMTIYIYTHVNNIYIDTHICEYMTSLASEDVPQPTCFDLFWSVHVRRVVCWTMFFCFCFYICQCCGVGLGYGLGRQHPVQCVKDAALVGFFSTSNHNWCYTQRSFLVLSNMIDATFSLQLSNIFDATLLDPIYIYIFDCLISLMLCFCIYIYTRIT